MKFLRMICAGLVREQMQQQDAKKDFAECGEFAAVIGKSGHFVGCSRLLPHAATTLRVGQDKVSTTDGPYAETKG